jgi:hypothetical protein
MSMGNAKGCLEIALVAAIIVGIITIYYTGNLESSGIIFIGTFLVITIYFLSKICSHCGNWGAVHVSDTRLIDTDQYQSNFSRQEQVGISVRRNTYGEVIDQTAHYRDVNYVTTTTVKTYEDTLTCKFCGATSTNRYQKQSHVTHRE